MSVIIVSDNVGILEINAAAFESKIQTADMICALANKYGVSVENIVFDGSGNTGRDIMKALERRYPYGLIPYFGSKPGGRFYTNARTACAAALARRLDPTGDHGVKREPFAIPERPTCASPVQRAGRVAVSTQRTEVRAGDQGRPDVAAGPQSRLCGRTLHDFSRGGNLWVLTRGRSP